MSNLTAHVADPVDARLHPRTHLFVAATLYADGGSTPVYLRNMSQSGALVEGSGLPDVGCRAVLRRGQFQASGHIAWLTADRVGIRFDHSICVQDWLPRPSGAAQQRVDDVLARLKGAPDVPGIQPSGPLPASIEGELLNLRSDLAMLESALIADVIVVATHPEIQTFDIALQRIDRILKQLRDRG